MMNFEEFGRHVASKIEQYGLRHTEHENAGWIAVLVKEKWPLPNSKPDLYQCELADGTIEHFAGCFDDVVESNGVPVVKKTPLFLHPPTPQTSLTGILDELHAAASLLETLSESLPDNDVNGIMMKVMAQRNRAVLDAEGSPSSREM